jgi:hypothetical protein
MKFGGKLIIAGIFIIAIIEFVINVSKANGGNMGNIGSPFLILGGACIFLGFIVLITSLLKRK